jgi:hypothetical protein
MDKKIKRFGDFGSVSEGAPRKNYFRDKFSEYPYGIYFSDKGMADAVGAKTVKELIDNVVLKRGLTDFAIFKQGSGFHSTTQEEYLVAWAGDGSYWANTAKKKPELMKKNAVNLGLLKESLDEAKTPENLPKRGMLMSVYRSADLGDTTAGGVTSKYKKVVLVGAGVPEIFSPSESAPAVYLDEREGKLGPVARPVDQKEGGTYMFGGNFIWTSDSRGRAFNNGAPIPVHDRFEDWATYDALSR